MFMAKKKLRYQLVVVSQGTRICLSKHNKIFVTIYENEGKRKKIKRNDNKNRINNSNL